MENITPYIASLMAYEMAENECILNVKYRPEDCETQEEWYREMAEGFILKIVATHNIVDSEGRDMSVADMIAVWKELIPVLVAHLANRVKIVTYLAKTSKI